MMSRCFPSFAPMKIHPDREAFHRLAREGNIVTVHTELMADFETPVSLYAKLRESGPAFLFESVEGGENVYRYTFLGCRPRKIFETRDGRTTIRESGGAVHEDSGARDPLAVIEEEMAGYRPVRQPELPPFTGGAVGFLGYEYVHHLEPVAPTEPARDATGAPTLFFMLIDSVLVFDRVTQTLRLCVNAHVRDGDVDGAYDAAVREINDLNALIAQRGGINPVPLVEPERIEVPPGNFTRPAFEKLVERAKEYIRAGDIIQVVLSQRFEREFSRAPLALYRALRTVNPSPYMFLLETDEFAAVGASPEVHVKLTGEKVEIRPIAGTRARGKTEDADLATEKELLADEKERAEHLMLVDLARNDIGRVCRFGSVHVPDYMFVERYSHVMHIVSRVEGKIAADKTAFDLMRATFPAGTLSGAPKVRAMQIISEMETDRRGLYAGALGYFSYDGNLDSCIAIRTAFLKDGRIYVQSGAGLVADSVPEREYQETVDKAKGMLKAIHIAENI
jgi:anthranilate synthase component I